MHRKFQKFNNILGSIFCCLSAGFLEKVLVFYLRINFRYMAQVYLHNLLRNKI